MLRGAAPLLLLAACSATQPPAPSARQVALQQRPEVQLAACLRPAAAVGCDAGMRVTFSSSGKDVYWRISETEIGVARYHRSGTIWCEDGKPRGHFVGFEARDRELTADLPQPVWDAIWRVLDKTGSCASAYGRPVGVGRGSAVRSCADPRLDMHELFDKAEGLARRGPPRPPSPEERGMANLCDLGGCPPGVPTPKEPCPPFRGDAKVMWNGREGPPWPAAAAPPALEESDE